MRGELGKKIAHPSAGLSVLTERPETLRKFPPNARKGLLPQFRVKVLPVSLFQFRFVVPRIHMAQPTGAENLDHPRRLCREMRKPQGQRVRGLRLPGEHRRQRHAPDAAPRAPEEFAARARHGDVMTGTTHGVAIPARPATGQGAGAFLSPSAGLPEARNPLGRWTFIVSFSLVKGNWFRALRTVESQNRDEYWG